MSCGCGSPYPDISASAAYYASLSGCYCSHYGVHSGFFNKCCSSCGGRCVPESGIACYQPYSSSQSFFLNNLKKRRVVERCSTTIFPCGDPRRSSTLCATCNLCGVAPRITSFSQIGGQMAVIKGAVSEGEYLNRLKNHQSKVFRSPQLSQSMLLRASRPVGSLAQRCASRKNTDGTALAMNRYPAQNLGKINSPMTSPCCSTIPMNYVLGYKHSVPTLHPTEPRCPMVA
jgi:hypothetical protein